MKLLLHSTEALLWVGIVATLAQTSGAYSVLTHEQVVDLLWQDKIVPTLKAKYPDLSDDQIKQAHAYAYGGSLVQDMGYYPFGSKYFSDLTHYVRSGDFVAGLLEEANTANEYAFALGALAHYAADNVGHPVINRVVAMDFPHLRKKFGDEVTYEDSPKDHIRVEFGFDMTEVAKNHYTSDRYHDSIGFEISPGLLERVFPKIYGISFTDVIHNEDMAIGSFRHAVGTIIPQMTRVALLTRRKEMVADTPNAAKKRYLYYLSRTNYEREWGTEYRRPGFGTRVLAFFLKMIPKRGPFSALNFKVPAQKAEDLFVKSIDDTVLDYGQLLDQVRAGPLHLADKDCDTGRDTRPGEYRLADKTYARLLTNLTGTAFQQASAELRQNILSYYSNPEAPQATKRRQKDWKKVRDNLRQLKEMTAGIMSQVEGSRADSAPAVAPENAPAAPVRP